MREVSKRNHLMQSLIAFVGTLLLMPVTGFAIECYECHGTKSPQDYRPVDAAYRNVTTGGFQGNHRTHTSLDDTKKQCEFCHAGSASYNQGHRNGKIDISPNINNSGTRALYDNRTSAWLQTATPVYGTCKNVNCHFENETLQWGSAPFAIPDGCSGCHGFPPAGGNSGAEGSHLAGGHAMAGGVSSCTFCHPGHSAFTHATSVRRNLLVTPKDPLSNAAGNYDGPTDDFLPSQTNQFGKCNNIYCHSNGTSVATSTVADNASPVWGGGPASCGSCHAYPPSYLNGTPKKNSHSMHASYNFLCSRCHAATTADNVSILNWQKHISRFYNISAQGERITYSFAVDGGTCSNGYCHSDGTFTSTGAVSANTVKWGSTSMTCSSCHGFPPAYENGTPKANSHGVHITYSCNKCHNQTTTDGISISDKSLHTNKEFNLLPGAGADFTYNFAATGGSCTNNSCHSDGTSVSTGIQSSQPATWGASLGCTGCHGLPPEYTNNSIKTNSHIGKHSIYLCNVCHSSTTSDGVSITNPANHANSQYNVTSAAGMFSYAYAPTGGTCTNVQCHANSTGYRQWGADKCDSCHGAPPNTPAHVKHFTGTPQQASYTSVKTAKDYAGATGYIFNCANCHPVDLNKHGNGILEIELYNTNAPAGSIKALQTTASYNKGNRYYLDSRGFAYTNGTCSNVYCHSYMTYTTPGGVPEYNNYSSYVPANLVETRVFRSIAWNGPSLTCTGCHENPPKSASPENDGGAGNSHAWTDEYGYDNLHIWNMSYAPLSCTTCHNETVKAFSAYTSPGGDTRLMKDVPIASFSKHVNGTNDVDFDTQRGYTYPPSSYGQVVFQPRSTTYNKVTKTCSNIACHFNETEVVWGTPYRWYNTMECNRCHRM